MISTLDQKIRLIEETGIDVLFLAPFDQPFSRLSPEEFVQQYLIDGLQARSVCVGSNFNFGYQQRGTSRRCGSSSSQFEMIEVPPVRVRGTIVSSSRIRQLVAAGAVSRACRLLGRWIEHRRHDCFRRGPRPDRDGADIESPAGERTDAASGASTSRRISLDGGPFLDAVTNIGVRPTFGESDLTIETFVLNDPVPDVSDDGASRFLHRLRDERKFEFCRTSFARRSDWTSVARKNSSRSEFGSSARRG